MHTFTLKNKYINLAKKYFVFIFMLANYFACGTSDADYPGRCKTAPDSKYVGTSADTNGEPWTYKMSPTSINITCFTKSDAKLLYFMGIIRDSKGYAKGGLVTQGIVAGANLSMARMKDADKTKPTDDTELSEKVTDRCGMAQFVVKWSCPEIQGEKASGSFYAVSGSLISEPANISIDHAEPPSASVSQVTITVTPRPASTP